ncbi:MAG: hypothetical protein ACI837_003428, partial [Crocinitomicaceae bacterium]
FLYPIYPNSTNTLKITMISDGRFIDISVIFISVILKVHG